MDKKFKNILKDYQKRISKEIEIFFDKKITKAKISFQKDDLRLIKEFSLRPAKRIRAILVIYGYSLAGGKKFKEILKTSAFIELIHNFLLIHDDIIDQDEFRRGKKTIHSFCQQSCFSKNNEEKKHYGFSMGMVYGDLVNSLGYEILSNSNFSDKYKIRAINKLNEAVCLTGSGQMFEMRLREKMGRGKKISENEIIAIYGNKTAFYSFLAPLQIGALLAGVDGGILKKIENFAMFLGVAFQIQDDIQEIFSSEKEIGKPLCSDIIEGQPNLLIVKALENKNLGKKLKEYIGNKNINKEDIEEIRNIMKETGSYDYCLRVKENFIKKAEGVLNSEGEFPRAEKQFLINLANYVSQRKN